MTTVIGYDSRVVVVLSSSNYSQAATLQIRMIPTNQQKMYEDNKLNSFSRGSEHFLFCPEYPTDYDTIRYDSAIKPQFAIARLRLHASLMSICLSVCLSV